MITNIRTKVGVDSHRNALGAMDGAKDYVETEPMKYFHVMISASIASNFKGELGLEVSHLRSGFHTYDIMENPPREILEMLGAGEEMCFRSNGIRIDRLLGRNYRCKDGQQDYVNVRLYLDNKVIDSRDFAVKVS